MIQYNKRRQRNVQPQFQINIKPYHRVNTYTRIPSFEQIFAYLTMLLQLIIFYSILFNKIRNDEYYILFLSLYSLFLVIMIISYFVCSCIDPTDSFIINQSKKSEVLMQTTRKNTQLSINQVNSVIKSQFYQCEYCQTNVLKTSKHCKICNRCTQQFDHHCKWINNCIGCKNYKSFFIMTLNAFLKSIIFISTGLYVSFQQNWNQFLIQIIVIWIVEIYIVVIAIFLLILVSFHIYLKITNQSTFQVLISSKKADLERRKKQIQQSLEKRQKQRKKQIQDNTAIQTILNNQVSQKQFNKCNFKSHKKNNKIANCHQQSGDKITFEEFEGQYNGQPIFQQELQVSFSRNNNIIDENINGNNNVSNNNVNSIGSFINKSKSLRLLIGQIYFVEPKKNYLSSRQPQYENNSQKYAQTLPHHSK